MERSTIRGPGHSSIHKQIHLIVLMGSSVQVETAKRIEEPNMGKTRHKSREECQPRVGRRSIGSVQATYTHSVKTRVALSTAEWSKAVRAVVYFATT